MKQPLHYGRLCYAIAIGMIVSLIAHPLSAKAQIRPDDSLGSERSTIRRNAQTNRGVVDRIDGGAIRGNNLFHSFSDFNVRELQRVYFRNPSSIENIISRVTGNSPSDIRGTLGVLGNANLFLINPNGIVFGTDAVLDVNGSFVASTADRVLFDSGYAFSAIEPNAPPLLNINSPIAGLESWLPQAGTIHNRGRLAVGGSLGLFAETLTLRGGLVAGGDIHLEATHRLTATDTATTPFNATAGGQLLLQGNEALEISALAHPLSGLASGEALTLRSDAPIVGDATFQAGGDIAIERLDGGLADLISVNDPVFQTAGDFSLDSYTGASLQILAGGSVTIPEGIFIESAGGPFNDSTVVLSNGQSLIINGSTEPTVDIRAGTTQFFGNPGSGNPTRADISVGPIVNLGGLVYLTNQFQPNPALAGDINASVVVTADGRGGGDVVMDSRGGISFNVIDTSGGSLAAIEEVGLVDALPGPAGNITLLAGGDIVMPFVPLDSRTVIFAYGTRGADITLQSDTAIIQESAPFGLNPDDLSRIESLSVGSVPNGTIFLSAPFISIGGNFLTTAVGRSTGGNIRIIADELVADQATILTDTFGQAASGNVWVEADAIALDYTLLGASSAGRGRSGNVTIRTGTLSGTRGAQIGSLAFDRGDAGAVDVRADTILLDGFQPGELNGGIFAPSSIFSSVEPDAAGSSGSVQITTRILELTNGAQVSTSSLGVGSAGRVEVTASEVIRIDGAVFTPFTTVPEPSSISSEVFTDAEVDSGRIVIRTAVLEVTNGGTITTSSNGRQAGAGSIRVTASESALFDGIVTFDDGRLRRISQAAVFVGADSNANAGNLTIITPSLSLTNSGQLTAEARGAGAGGNIFVQGTDLILEDGNILAETASNTGGNITLRVDDVISLQDGSRISATAGTAQAGGDGGNILAETQFLVADPEGNNDLTANAFEGAGGSVDITAEGIFGLVPRSRSELEALLGTTDPAALDPANLPTSDITAISQTNPNLDGQVIIRSPDVDPSQDVAELPSVIVDASRLIARGCTAAGTTLAQEVGSLIVTGRGGLPESPGGSLGSQDLLLGWDSAAASVDGEGAQAIAPQPQLPIVEVQALTRLADGRVVLTAPLSGGSPHPTWNTEATCASPAQ